MVVHSDLYDDVGKHRPIVDNLQYSAFLIENRSEASSVLQYGITPKREANDCLSLRALRTGGRIARSVCGRWRSERRELLDCFCLATNYESRSARVDAGSACTACPVGTRSGSSGEAAGYICAERPQPFLGSPSSSRGLRGSVIDRHPDGVIARDPTCTPPPR